MQYLLEDSVRISSWNTTGDHLVDLMSSLILSTAVNYENQYVRTRSRYIVLILFAQVIDTATQLWETVKRIYDPSTL